MAKIYVSYSYLNIWNYKAWTACHWLRLSLYPGYDLFFTICQGSLVLVLEPHHVTDLVGDVKL